MKKIGYMKKTIKIGLIGNKYHVLLLQRQLKSRGIEALNLIDNVNFNAIREIEVLHSLWGLGDKKAILIANLLKKKIIMHWIGTDAYSVIKRLKYRIIAMISNLFVSKNVAISDNITKELHDIGFDIETVPFISEAVGTEIMPLPKTFSIATYIPDDRSEFYGRKWVYDLAKVFPETIFYVVSGEGGKIINKPSNIKYLGHVNDINEIFKKASLFLRLTEHDGLSHLVLEALARGRNVLWTIPFPHCYHAINFDNSRIIIDHLKLNHEINYKGANYVKEKYDQNIVLNGIINMYCSVLGNK